MKTFCCIVLLALCAACNLLKNSSRSVDQQMVKREKHSTLSADLKTENRFKSGSVLRIKDSLDNSYSIQLWPKGVFTFSQGNGFTGEADSVIITGKLKKRTASSNTKKLFVETKSAQKIDASEGSQLVKETKNKEVQRKTSWRVIVLLFFITGLAVWMIIKYLVNRP